MNLIHEQVDKPVKTNDDLNNDHYRDNVNQSLRYFLMCISCLWNITFYESTDSMHFNSKKMQCLVCKEVKLKSVAIRVILWCNSFFNFC
jgi:hypothetical protein